MGPLMSARRALLLLSAALWFGAGALVGVAMVDATRRLYGASLAPSPVDDAQHRLCGVTLALALPAGRRRGRLALVVFVAGDNRLR